jgi:hypothetical protein
MACDKCLRKFDKQYLEKLSRLSLVQRLTDKGKRLVAQYGERISTPCQHEVSNG